MAIQGALVRIAFLGTRGVPAAYGGFETAAEEIGRRLVERDNEVTVYCRQPGPPTYLGMRCVRLPALRRRTLETLSNTFLSCLHADVHKPDVAIVFNVANSLLLPMLKVRGIPVAVHVDGLEWRRGKWAGMGQPFYRRMEGMAVAWSDALIADADAIATYYRNRFGIEATVLRYGAPLLVHPAIERVRELGLRPGEFHLVVARIEPENHVHLIAQGYRESAARYPLVVVGSNPYSTSYTRGVKRLLASDPRIMAVGSIFDQELLDALYASCITYSHGHSVGGTNPSLLRAMGAGASVLAMDNQFNREVLADTGRLFDDSLSIARLFEAAEASPATTARFGRKARARAAAEYNWDEVAYGYEMLCRRIINPPSLLRALHMAADSSDPVWPPKSPVLYPVEPAMTEPAAPAGAPAAVRR